MNEMNRTSTIARINPLAQLAATLCCLIPVFLSYDPVTPAPFVVYGLIVILWLGRTPFRTVVRTLGPLLALPAGLFLLNAAFSAPPPGAHTVTLLFIRTGPYAVRRATILAERSLALIVLSVGYLLVTRPQDLVGSMMQQLRLSPRIGYSIYVAWNTIPVLRDNLNQIQDAHAVRLCGEPRRPKDALPTAVALLTGAIRHAERASLSMTARGIERPGRRTFYRETSWRVRDTIYTAGWLAIVGATVAVLVVTHRFVFGLG